MHPRVERLPRPDPDYRRFLAAVGRQGPDRVPLIELAVAREIVAELLEESAAATASDPVDRRRLAEHTVRLLHRLGYDVVKVSAGIPFDIERLVAEKKGDAGTDARQWRDERRGVLSNMEDFERFAWPGQRDLDLGPVEAALGVLPDGMAAVGFSGGVLEFALDLIGFERFMYATIEQPDLVTAVLDGVGRTIYETFELFCQMEPIKALWLGDDLGYKTGLFLSPDFLNANVFPWYRRYVELAHRHGRPFLLHSCGNTAAVMPVLVEEVGIDAKHSFEDEIEPVEGFIDAWGAQVCVLGGVDVHILSAGSEEDVAKRTRQILEHAAPSGAYACGSGNSIPNYIPARNYLAMIEALMRFNGRL